MARLKRNDSSRCGCVCSIAPSDVIEGANFGSHIAGPSSRSKDTAGHIKRTAGEGSHAFDSFPLPSSSQTSTNSFPGSSLCARRQGRESGARSSSAPRRGTGQMAGSAAAGSRRAAIMALSWGKYGALIVGTALRCSAGGCAAPQARAPVARPAPRHRTPARKADARV